MSSESAVREHIVAVGKSLYRRGLSPGTSGNLSVRVTDGYLMTPTDTALGDLDPRTLCKLNPDGDFVDGDRPTKELHLHLSLYRHRPQARAIVHLHATHSAAVSCLEGLDPSNCLPPLTAYHVLKVGRLPLIPYHPPGDPTLAHAIAAYVSSAHAVLLANHGPLVSGSSLQAAAAAAEELEETAKLHLMLKQWQTRPLTATQVASLHPDHTT